MPSAFYEAQRTKKDAVAVWTVHVHFDAFFELPEKDFYWSTAEGGIELVDGNTYIHALASIPRGRQQRDRGNDYSEFVVANPEASVLDEFEDYQDICEKGEVTICECYEIIEGQGIYEEEIKFFGYIKDFNVDETDHTIKFTAMSDMSRSGFYVGGRVLTREKCGTEFNFDGLIAASIHPCGWQVAQGGNPDFCSKLADGVDGCKAHNNFHRFYAVPALSTAEITVLPGDGTIIGGGGGGWEYESGPAPKDISVS